jgi:hypothetical protein
LPDAINLLCECDSGVVWSAAWKIDPVAGWTASNTDP